MYNQLLHVSASANDPLMPSAICSSNLDCVEYQSRNIFALGSTSQLRVGIPTVGDLLFYMFGIVKNLCEV